MTHVSRKVSRFSWMAAALALLVNGAVSQACMVPETYGESTADGLINLNPNNNEEHEFKLIDPDGNEISRDDLHADSNVDGDGVFYEGPAVFVRVTPKGSGSQQYLHLDGVPFDLKNPKTHILEGSMNVKVFNDHLHNGKAMGKWWIELHGTLTIEVNPDFESMCD